VVGEDTVQFLGHSAVETAKAGLHMGYGDMEFRRCQSPGQRCVGVAVDHHQVRLLLEEDLLHALEHLAGLVPVRA